MWTILCFCITLLYEIVTASFSVICISSSWYKRNWFSFKMPVFFLPLLFDQMFQKLLTLRKSKPFDCYLLPQARGSVFHLSYSPASVSSYCRKCLSWPCTLGPWALLWASHPPHCPQCLWFFTLSTDKHVLTPFSSILPLKDVIFPPRLLPVNFMTQIGY